MDKVIALLWALHLVMGTNYEQLEWLMCHIVSVTSDMGTEFGITDCPNVLRAFLRRRMGVPMQLLHGTVCPVSRLFPRAVKDPWVGPPLRQSDEVCLFQYRSVAPYSQLLPKCLQGVWERVLAQDHHSQGEVRIS